MGTDVLGRRVSQTRLSEDVPLLPFSDLGRTTLTQQLSAIGNLRTIVNPTNPACNETQRKVIWMFGGSALFGMGVPDSETISSHLSHELNSASYSIVAMKPANREGESQSSSVNPSRP